jgi:hypothetical protein
MIRARGRVNWLFIPDRVSCYYNGQIEELQSRESEESEESEESKESRGSGRSGCPLSNHHTSRLEHPLPSHHIPRLESTLSSYHTFGLERPLPSRHRIRRMKECCLSWSCISQHIHAPLDIKCA